MSISSECKYQSSVGFAAQKHNQWVLLKSSFMLPLDPPSSLFLILSIDIIIPTGISITSMWQPKRWHQRLFKSPLCFSPTLTAVALSWPQRVKKPWRLLTASSGACCKQTASGMHDNVTMHTERSSLLGFNFTHKFTSFRSGFCWLQHNTTPYPVLHLSCCHC